MIPDCEPSFKGCGESLLYGSSGTPDGPETIGHYVVAGGGGGHALVNGGVNVAKYDVVNRLYKRFLIPIDLYALV